MPAPMTSPPAVANTTLAGMREGAWLCLPLIPGTIMMSAAFGAIAAQKGMTLLEAVLTSGLMFAGAAQLVAMEVWNNVWTVGTIVALALVAATVNMRYILMGAALQPWLTGMPRGRIAAILFLLVDATWIMAMRYRSEGGSDAGIMIGGGATMWAFWVAGTVPGYLLGDLVRNPQRFGLDLVVPIFFAAMLVPLWRGRRRAIGWLVAGAVAWAVAHLIGGYWYIIVGAIVGSVAGAFLDERR
jgi:predicted branched-subunit amino acid permease